jgi:hypothetical protein
MVSDISGQWSEVSGRWTHLLIAGEGGTVVETGSSRKVKPGCFADHRPPTTHYKNGEPKLP